jgi:general secretion pathway protein L
MMARCTSSAGNEANKVADKFIIYLGHKGEAVQWAVANPSTHAVLEEGRGSLAQAAEVAHGRRVVALVPSDEVLLTEVTVPSRNPSKVRIAVPNLLEEALSDDIDDLHYAIGAHHEGDVYPVVVMSKQRIEYYQHVLGDAGIRIEKLMPSVLALPYADKHWSVLQEGDEVVVRESEYIGFSCAPDNLKLFFKQALQGLDDADMPVVHTFQDSVDIPEALSVEVEQQEAVSLMHVFVEGIEQGLVINLLQGEYKPLRKENPAWNKWRRTAVLAGLLAILWLGMTFQEAYTLKTKNERLIAEIHQIYSQTFPGSRIVNPRAQMKQKLGVLKGSGSKASGDFLAALSKVSVSVKGAADTLLKGVSFRKGMLDFDVQVKDLKSLEVLRGTLSGSEVLTAKSEDGVVNGRIRVK